MKKINFTKEQIKEIYEDLQMGMRSFYNPETGEITPMPDFINNPDADEGAWEEVIEYVESNWGLLIEFEKMPSNRSFELMEEFIEIVDDKRLQQRLINALNRNKPFSNFKYEIDNSGEFREIWFKFRDEKYKEWVLDHIDRINEKND